LNLLKRPSKLRTLLLLGRVSNLPTVWSNCWAGWWLGGGETWAALVCVSISATLLYLGGMFLNDAFDADFDRQHRRSRPIPSGAIGRGEVWRWGLGLMALGLAGVLWLGWTTIVLTLVLCAFILLYNAVHKILPVAPVLMGGCRFFLYLVAAAAGARGVDGEVIWKGLMLGVYVAGLSCLARKESNRVGVQFWPGLLLAAPVLMAGLADDGPSAEAAILFSVVLTGWSCWALSRSLERAGTNVGYTVSRLLAGIVLVDLLAVAEVNLPHVAIGAFCFVLALLWQRFIPAT
jgi:hypothetical protein